MTWTGLEATMAAALVSGPLTERASGLDAVGPVAPLFVTPRGIARSAPAREPAYESADPGTMPP